MGRPRKTPKAAAKTKASPKPKNQPARAESPLPPPVEVQVGSVQPSEPSGGLFGLDRVFQNQPRNESPSSVESVDFSTPISEPRPGDPLSQDAEQILARVPSTVDAGPEAEPLQPAAVDDDDPIAALMAQVAFEEQDVKDTLCEFFDWLATKFDNDNWKLTDRQSRMLGKPTAQLANSLWARLQTILPDVIARWCAETPGAFAFLSACGLVVLPKVMNQIKVSRERKAKGKAVRQMPSPAARPAATFTGVPAMSGGR